MIIQTRLEGDTAVVAINGKLDMVTAAEFRSKVDEALAGGAKRAIVDMAELSYMSSAGIGALTAIAIQFQKAGGELRVANVQPNVQKIIEICGIGKMVRVHASVAEALAAQG